MRYFSLICLMIFTNINAQGFIEKLITEENNVRIIEDRANKYLKKVKSDKENKLFERWLYFAKIDADEKGGVISNRNYVNALHQYNYKTNFKDPQPSQQTITWTNLGPDYYNDSNSQGWNPGVGRITSLAFIDTDNFIVGSPTGGIWKTNDSGNNWNSLTDNLSNIDVWSLAISPDDSNIYYWGSNEGRIYKSLDAGSTWTLINQSSLLGNSSYHRVNKILIHPTSTEIIYASVENYGIFRSEDSGQNWSRIHSDCTNGYDIEFKPGNASVVYATGNSFFGSVDNGMTFEIRGKPDLTIENSKWSQDILNGGSKWTYSAENQNGSVTPYAGTGLAYYYSGNWNQDQALLISKEIDLSSAINPTLSFQYSNANWEGDTDELSWYWKTSESESWQQGELITQVAENWSSYSFDLSTVFNYSTTFQIAFLAKSNWGRGITLDEVLIHDNNLDSIFFEEGFEERESLLAGNFSTGAKMIGVSNANPEKVYVLEEKNGTFGGLYYSDNSSNTFVKIDHGDNNYFGYSSTADDDRGQAPRDMDITVNPDNENIIYMSGILSWFSNDGGNNFQISSQWIPANAFNQNIGYCHADIDITEFIDGNLFVGSDGGVFKASQPNTISSSYYQDLSTGLSIRQFYKIGISQGNQEIVSGGSQDNGTSVLINGSWNDWLGADGMETFIDKDDSNLIYGTSQYGSLYFTSNAGQTYQTINPPLEKAGSENGANWVVPFEKDPEVSNKIYVAYDEVFSNTNLEGWIKISQTFSENIDVMSIAPSNNQTIYISVNNLMYKTDNQGQSDWEEISLPDSTGNINAIAIHPENKNHIAAAVSGTHKVIYSQDGGDTWEILKNDLPNFSASAITFHGNNLVLGMNYGVFYNHSSSRDTWSSISNNLPNVRITELEINSSLNKIYAATYGRGLWVADLEPLSLSNSKLDQFEFEIFPNPVESDLNILTNKAIQAQIKIYDFQGRLVYFSKNVRINNQFKIDIQSLNSGMYVLKLTDNTTSSSFKFQKK